MIASLLATALTVTTLQASDDLPPMPAMVTASDYIRFCSSQNDVELIQCIGFTEGVIAAAVDISDAAAGTAMFCTPDNITIGEVVDNAVMDVRRDRSLWASSPAGAIILTLIRRYPCAGSTFDASPSAPFQ